MSDDGSRAEIYGELQQRQMSAEEQLSRHSAQRILSILKQYIEPRSLLDVGCGLGTWLREAQEAGIQDLLGVEGPWLNRALLEVEDRLVQTHDLEKPFSMGRRFDLVLCLEVAEHLNPAAAPQLIATLVAHGDCILFSAAIPMQGGGHHVNEQFVDYWIDLFAKHHYRPVDCVRWQVWNDDAVHWWLRQNCILFCSDGLLDSNQKLREQREINRPLSIVHPGVYLSRVKESPGAMQLNSLLRQLRGGGRFDVTPTADGKLVFTRVKA